jgi:hypothetical protein
MKYELNKIKVVLENYKHLLRGPAKLGKAQPLYSKVQTPNGEIAIGDLEVGDTIFSVNGDITEVIGVYPQGLQNVYEITFTDGAKVKCSDEHLWSVRTKKMKHNGRGFTKVLTLKEMLGIGLYTISSDNRKMYRYEIPIGEAVDYEYQELPIDPYLLGVLIGDGYISGRTVGFSNTEKDIIDHVTKIVEKNGLSVKKSSDYNYNYTIKKPEGVYRNTLIEDLRNLDLFGKKSADKFIPNIYKFNTIENRVRLIQGLMDTDGHVTVAGGMRFSTISNQLALDFQFIIESLGGICSINTDDRPGKESFILTPRIENYNIVTSEKHLKKSSLYNPLMKRSIENAEFIGQEECVCIKVADESELYLTDHFVVTHNTTLYRDLILEAYGTPEAGLLISPSNETGFRAIDNLYAQEAPTWKSFVDIIDDLVDNKADNNFKIICIDTIDALVEIATDRVLQMHYHQKGEHAVSLNAALGGYSAGQNKVSELINDQIKRLEAAQYGIFFIGHCKLKKITDPETGLEYEQVVGNLESRFDSIFINKSDIICTLAMSKEIVEGKLVGTDRKLYFRANSYIDAGSRFKGMPESVSYGPREYIKAFEEGVKSSYSTPITNEEMSKIRKEEIKEKEQKKEEYLEKVIEDKENLTAESLISKITETLSSLEPDVKVQKKEELKKAELPSAYKKLEDVEILKSILDILQSN